jgi:hypothetical protein
VAVDTRRGSANSSGISIIANAAAAAALKALGDIAVDQNEFIDEALRLAEPAASSHG